MCVDVPGISLSTEEALFSPLVTIRGSTSPMSSPSPAAPVPVQVPFPNMLDTDQGQGGSSPHTDQGKGSSSLGIFLRGGPGQLFISDSIQAKGVAGVKALLQNLKLEAPATPLDPFSVEMACYLKANTRRQYHYKKKNLPQSR